ncbi:FkbM family methyltransferase [Calothrix sp. PCC 7507]|uniref:FkbM family methyltransferase n=1 Tax=Calothrix sp. PCC 7507 TaxID=99598 RepID=UPI00029F3E40|nr:FkbM family methyltransferase [Calothrix sp. PCC 7507]AFY34957.1 methyltransferase FkbM family [Calothrix sp. PCC 7507]
MFKSWEVKLRNLRVKLLGYVPDILLKPVAESSDVFKKILPYNFYILLNIQDTSISRPLLIKGSYEQSVSELFVKYLKPDSCVIDIGANIGYYSLLAASQCPRGKVLSFEPDNKNFQLLKTSIAYNQFEEIIQAYNLAVSDANKTIIISDLGNTANSGARFTAEDENLLKSLISAPDAYFQKIEAIQLDTFLTEIRVDVVKIDIEGHEPYAILGMLNILKRDQPIIFAELAPSNIKLLGGMEAADFLQLLLNIGYRISLIEKRGNLLEFNQDIPAVMSYFGQQKTHHVDILLTV